MLRPKLEADNDPVGLLGEPPGAMLRAGLLERLAPLPNRALMFFALSAVLLAGCASPSNTAVGPAPATTAAAIKMPALDGDSFGQARSEASELGIGDMKVKNAAPGHDITDDWTVTSQFPVPGFVLKEETPVTITVEPSETSDAYPAFAEEQAKAKAAAREAEEKAAEEERKAEEKAAEEQRKAEAAEKKEAEAQAKAEAEAKKYEDEWVIRYILESDAPIDLATYTTWVGGSMNQSQDSSASQTKLVKTLKFPASDFSGTYEVWSFGVDGMAGPYAGTITCKIEVNGKIVEEQTSTGPYSSAMCTNGGYEVNF